VSLLSLCILLVTDTRRRRRPLAKWCW
jgi:hypothetical protein